MTADFEAAYKALDDTSLSEGYADRLRGKLLRPLNLASVIRIACEPRLMGCHVRCSGRNNNKPVTIDVPTFRSSQSQLY